MNPDIFAEFHIFPDCLLYTSACFSIFSLEEMSFPSRIYSARSSSSSFNLAGSTASPITSIRPIFSFLIWWYSCLLYTSYELNSEFTVTGDTDFYIVRRTALQVNFKTNTGASNSKFTRLSQKVGKGLTVTMPQVPVKTGYQSLGWSKNKKASKADYKAGDVYKRQPIIRGLYSIFRRK